MSNSFGRYPNRSNASSRAGRRAARGAQAFARVGAEPSSDVGAYLTDLNRQIEQLAKDVQAQGDPVGWPRFKWFDFLLHELPTSVLVPGVAPQYTDGPVGWRTYYKLNLASPLALSLYPDRLRREGAEYQSKLHAFHAIFSLQKGKPTLPPPLKPSVTDMPGAIDPVDLAKGIDPTGLGSILGDAPLQKVVADALGLPARQLRIGAGVALASLAVLAGRILLR